MASSLDSVVQRDPKPSPARARVLTEMTKLQQKYQLEGVTEGPGRSWTLKELDFVDRAFAMMSTVERRNLRGVTLTRVKELFRDKGGKQVPVAGRATNGALIELADRGMRDLSVPLHEAGHIIQTRAVLTEQRQLDDSRVGRVLDQSYLRLAEVMKKLPPKISFGGQHAQQISDFAIAISTFSKAGTALIESDPEEDATEVQDAFLAADVDAANQRQGVQGFVMEPWVPQLLEIHDRQREWGAAIEAWMTAKTQQVGPRRNYTEFIDIVTRNKLAQRGFAPFTEYVQENWPKKPGEFFAQSYATYRENPNYLKKYARDLFNWFERGGHMAPMSRERAALENVRDQSPVIGELAESLLETFGGVRQVPDLIP